MPIANCYLAPDLAALPADSLGLVDLWAAESTKSVSEMTANLIVVSQQAGRQYRVIAELMLPSLWQEADISLLQLGLGKALCAHFQLPASEVIVVTRVIETGRVVESGIELRW